MDRNKITYTYVIEQVEYPGRYYANAHKDFKPYMWATYYMTEERALQEIANKDLENVMLTKVLNPKV